MHALLCLAILTVPPEVVVEGGLEPRPAIQAAARAAWADLEAAYREATGVPLAAAASGIRVAPSSRGMPAESGSSRLGKVMLRQRQAGVIDDSLLLTIRHEMAHQFLFVACPAASDDRLFHEAFAVGTSGELQGWATGDYLSTPQARRLLERAQSLDAPSSRRALARLLVESAAGEGTLPLPLARRLRACQAGGRWSEPLTLAELALPGAATSADALIVLSRHSGEVLLAEGAAHLPMPFGSTLKPLLVAGATTTPLIAPDRRRSEWLCGDALPSPMDVRAALLRSCNGYFLDWGAREPQVHAFGPFGALLVRLGLSRLPADMGEALGLRPTLSLSPWALAQAYRALAEASPGVIEILRANAKQGTLSGLAASPELAGFATKTGTVRDPHGRPWLGLVVAVSDDLVVVKTARDRPPRSFAAQLTRDLSRARAIAGQQAAKVQTFCLLPRQQVEARCAGVPVVAGAALELAGSDFQPLVQLVEHGEALCLGAPWLVRFPGTLAEGRPYAGVFALSPLPPGAPAEGATLKQQRARRGSEILFRTTLARYTAGVLASEDAAIAGEARIALGRVIAHNVAVERHPGRPLCDTTHCQVFQGTAVPAAGDERIFSGSPLGAGFMLFSRGGSEPWQQQRSQQEVEEVLGERPTGLRFVGGRVFYRRTVAVGAEPYDEAAELPCDLLRVSLRLPSCPESASAAAAVFIFTGRGVGHGEGLDVEGAKASGIDADEILRRAYPRTEGRVGR